ETVAGGICVKSDTSIDHSYANAAAAVPVSSQPYLFDLRVFRSVVECFAHSAGKGFRDRQRVRLFSRWDKSASPWRRDDAAAGSGWQERLSWVGFFSCCWWNAK